MPGRKYTGNTDGVSRTGARPGTLKLVDLCQRRWGFTNLGVFANRPVRNPNVKPNSPQSLSVHATGRACDLGYANRDDALQAWDWFLKHSRELGIEAIHDYAFDSTPADGQPGWGRGYRCDRGEGKAGVRVFTATNNAGSRGGRWLHIELNPAMADNPRKFEAVWRSLPKPGE